jgi:hypothetical protein
MKSYRHIQPACSLTARLGRWLATRTTKRPKSELPGAQQDGSVSATRRELEATCLQRVNQARLRYKQKVAVCKALLDEHPGLPCNPASDPDGTLALEQALQRKSEALEDYSRAVRIYTRLMVRGMVPTEESELCPANHVPFAASAFSLT